MHHLAIRVDCESLMLVDAPGRDELWLSLAGTTGQLFGKLESSNGADN